MFLIYFVNLYVIKYDYFSKLILIYLNIYVTICPYLNWKKFCIHILIVFELLNGCYKYCYR